MVNDKLKIIIREAVREGIEDALTKYGIDTANPNSMQADLIPFPITKCSYMMLCICFLPLHSVIPS